MVKWTGYLRPMKEQESLALKLYYFSDCYSYKREFVGEW